MGERRVFPFPLAAAVTRVYGDGFWLSAALLPRPRVSALHTVSSYFCVSCLSRGTSSYSLARLTTHTLPGAECHSVGPRPAREWAI